MVGCIYSSLKFLYSYKFALINVAILLIVTIVRLKLKTF